ncbi:SCO6880 family protein [Nocardia sp. NPDC058518]|uniref:SCO6880 family protein n=1 Tax=Nocardia sp. NPDC058518 TaxID=3346534 RepID=UPI0036535C99
MVNQQLSPEERPTYGPGREVRRTFAYGLSRGMFYAIFVSILLGVVIALVGFRTVGIGWAVLSLVSAWPMSQRIGGKTIYEQLVLERKFRRERRSGRNVLRAGPLSHAPGGRTRLPGVAASTEMWWGIDKYGRRFGMIRMHTTGQYTAVLRCSARGMTGMEQAAINEMVAQWGDFIATTGQPGDIAGIVPIVEVLPETGARLGAEIRRIDSPNAPAQVRDWLQQAGSGHDADANGTQLHTRIAITWNARTAAKKQDPMLMLADLAERIPTMCEQLRRVQVVATPMSDHQIAATVRRCFEPRLTVEMAVEQLMRYSGEPPAHEIIDWVDAGPIAADDNDRATYSHDNAYSRCWVMTAPPAGFFNETVLKPLMEPRADIPRRRLAMFLRPLNPTEAANSAHKDLLSATADVSGARGMTSARAELKLRATHQARDEEAKGAGVVDQAMIFTVSADSRAELEAIAEIVEKDLFPAARIQMRPAYRTQASTFLAGLGIGVLLPDHASVSKTLQGTGE